MTLAIRQPIKTLVYASLGLFIRIFVSTHFKDNLRQRVEITTPINDWKRIQEAIYLWNSGLDPYSGNLLHEYPVSLQFYKIIASYFNVDLAFAITDVIIALLLRQSLASEQSSKAQWVFLTYLFSPLTILACAGQSTSIFTNFLISIICLTLQIEQFRALTCVLCAFLACNNIHYATTILPIFLCIEYCSYRRQNKQHSKDTSELTYYSNHKKFLSSLIISGSLCLLSVITLMLASYLLMSNKWSFLKATYLFVLRVQDLTPNIGMIWYFFTVMFDFFADFFICVVQINAFIHAIPISVCLRDHPFFALSITILMSTIFQPYPNLAHIGLTTSLLAQYLDLIPFMRQGLKVACAMISCLSLMPVFWHLWIMMDTANANFYFGATLAFSASLVLLLMDLLTAHGHMVIKRKYDLYNKEKTESGCFS
uniref:Phosphatidylinositol glycan anchor biosynthesis class U protein n=1 Tax=Aceria tosichella TaxID=561515 RepID=A0A6G1S8S4_9ACAR